MPTAFQFLDSVTAKLGTSQFTVTGVFADPLPTGIGQITTFSGTYLDQFFSMANPLQIGLLSQVRHSQLALLTPQHPQPRNPQTLRSWGSALADA